MIACHLQKLFRSVVGLKKEHPGEILSRELRYRTRTHLSVLAILSIAERFVTLNSGHKPITSQRRILQTPWQRSIQREKFSEALLEGHIDLSDQFSVSSLFHFELKMQFLVPTTPWTVITNEGYEWYMSSFEIFWQHNRRTAFPCKIYSTWQILARKSNIYTNQYIHKTTGAYWETDKNWQSLLGRKWEKHKEADLTALTVERYHQTLAIEEHPLPLDPFPGGWEFTTKATNLVTLLPTSGLSPGYPRGFEFPIGDRISNETNLEVVSSTT